MKLLLFILIQIALLSGTSFASQCQPSADNCNAYLCLEEELQCGYKGFPLKYGYRFCKNFVKIIPTTEKMDMWLTKTRYCLQEKILQNSEYSCKNLFSQSINDHVTCYIENGFCDMSNKEKIYVEKFILKEFLQAPIYILKNARSFLRKGCR